MSTSPESPTPPIPVTAVAASPAQFGRTAVAILATMVLLIVALTGILVETTWRQPSSDIEVAPPDPGSFARR